MAKKKLLTGAAYWRLQDLLAEGEAKVNEYGEWARKKCRELELLPDVTDFVQGVIWNEPLRAGDETQHRTQVSNINSELAIATALDYQAKIAVINKQIDVLAREIAIAAGVRLDQVNVRTGEITDDPEVEYLELDLPSDK